MTEESQHQFEIYLQEYSKLKDEQGRRIDRRDNLINLTLGLFGGVVAFALHDQGSSYALLVLPWISFILGWNYLVNDEKISAIGRYIRCTLAEKIAALTGSTDIESILGWEIAHRSDRRRHQRKNKQLIIDEITFVLSGMTALVAFWGLNFCQKNWLTALLASWGSTLGRACQQNLPSGAIQIPSPIPEILSLIAKYRTKACKRDRERVS